MIQSDGDASVTGWIAGLKQGEAAAAQQLWDRYFRRLVGLARTKLTASSRRLADEEDVALSAFKSFCLAAAGGRFPLLRDRDNLWPLLVVLTTRKAKDLRKHEGRLKRGGLPREHSSSRPSELEAIVGDEPTPEFAAMVAENCERLLGMLEAPLRQIALFKLDGHTAPEIAARLDCGVRTVERRLELIRRTWAGDDRQLTGTAH